MSCLPIIPPPQYQQSSTPIINMPNWYYFGSNLIVQRCFLTDLQVITLVDQWLHIWPLNLHIIILHHHLAESLLIPQGLHCTPQGTWKPHHPQWAETKQFLPRFLPIVLLPIMLLPVFQCLAPHWSLLATHNAYLHLVPLILPILLWLPPLHLGPHWNLLTKLISYHSIKLYLGWSHYWMAWPGWLEIARYLSRASHQTLLISCRQSLEHLSCQVGRISGKSLVFSSVL